MRLLLATVLTLIATPAFAELEETEHDTWAAFAKARSGECVGAPGRIKTPLKIEVGKHRYEIRGHRLVQLDKDKDQVLRIGVISATKDERDETLAAIEKLTGWMKKKKMDVLVVNGDIATHEFFMEEKLLPKIASVGVLVIAHVGNTESCGMFNQAAEKIFAKHRNFINANWVRQIELDDGTLFTLPGYHDAKFVHTGGAAKYSKDDLRTLKYMLKEKSGPKILVAHGPPQQKGKRGLDIVGDGDHVGDPDMTALIKDANLSFGIFGHILEAGGRGTDLLGRKKRKQKKWHRSLFVNAGTANPDPWAMLDGRTSYGMGLFFELKGKKARYQVKKLKAPR